MLLSQLRWGVAFVASYGEQSLVCFNRGGDPQYRYFQHAHSIPIMGVENERCILINPR